MLFNLHVSILYLLQAVKICLNNNIVLWVGETQKKKKKKKNGRNVNKGVLNTV